MTDKTPAKNTPAKNTAAKTPPTQSPQSDGDAETAKPKELFEAREETDPVVINGAFFNSDDEYQAAKKPKGDAKTQPHRQVRKEEFAASAKQPPEK